MRKTEDVFQLLADQPPEQQHNRTEIANTCRLVAIIYEIIGQYGPSPDACGIKKNVIFPEKKRKPRVWICFYNRRGLSGEIGDAFQQENGRPSPWAESFHKIKITGLDLTSSNLAFSRTASLDESGF